MTMHETWIKWEPVSGLNKKYYIDSVCDDKTGFRVILSDADDEKHTLHMIFENGVTCHRDTDESYIGNLLLDLGNRYGNEFYWDWTLFKVTDSEYIKWLSNRSDGISDETNFIHYSLLAVNTNLDIIAVDEPIFEFVNLS